MTETALEVTTRIDFVDDAKYTTGASRSTAPLLVVFKREAFGALVGLLRQVQRYNVIEGSVPADIKTVFQMVAVEIRRDSLDDSANTVYTVEARCTDMDDLTLVFEARFISDGLCIQETPWVKLLSSEPVATD